MYRKQRKGILYKRTLYFDKFRGINYGIPLCLFMLGSTGLLMLFSISGGEFNQTVINHFFRLMVGFIFFIFFSFISFRILRVISFPMYFVILAMLAWLYIFESSTVSRWISLGGTSFQPSEFLKFILRVYILCNMNCSSSGSSFIFILPEEIVPLYPLKSELERLTH